jgi:hypothetical protein
VAELLKTELKSINFLINASPYSSATRSEVPAPSTETCLAGCGGELCGTTTEAFTFEALRYADRICEPTRHAQNSTPNRMQYEVVRPRPHTEVVFSTVFEK